MDGYAVIRQLGFGKRLATTRDQTAITPRAVLVLRASLLIADGIAWPISRVPMLSRYEASAEGSAAIHWWASYKLGSRVVDSALET